MSRPQLPNPSVVAKDAFASERLGFPFLLFVIYLIMEYGRPANPMGIPLLISILLFVWWLTLRHRTWSRQIPYYILLLSIIAIMGPFAVNTHSVWWSFRSMAVQLLCICLPLIQLTSSTRRMSGIVSCLLAVLAYVAIYGITHGGVGPGGHIGDENDLALALTVTIPFAFFNLLSAKSLDRRALYLGILALYVFATATTLSRGGFIALLATGAYCLIRMPKSKRVPAIIIIGLMAFGLSVFAPQGFWEEMATIHADAVDTENGTGALRREYWAIAGRMFMDNPILGVGLGNFTWNIPEYQSREQFERAGRSYAGNVAHSLYFTLFAELGVAGLLIFFLILKQMYRDTQVVLQRASEYSSRSTRGDTQHPHPHPQPHSSQHEIVACYAHAIRAGTLGYLVGGFFLSVFAYPHLWLLTAMAAGLRAATELEPANNQKSVTPHPSSYVG